VRPVGTDPVPPVYFSFTMRYTAVMASRAVLALVVFVAPVTSACVQGGQDAPSGKANGGGQKDTSERSNPVVREEPTIQQDERQILTGVVSDKEKGPCPYSKRPCTRILVEEAPDADCRGGRGPLKPGCEKMYFDVTGKTEVFRKGGDTRKERASAAELHEGLRVSADYTSYDVAESYPSQTAARVVTILGSR
jgi:hypothetical protein